MSIKAAPPFVVSSLPVVFCTRNPHPVQSTCPDAFGVPCSPPERYQGNLISSLLEQTSETLAAGKSALRSGPALVHKPESGRNYFRLTQLPAEAEIHCNSVDCENSAKLLIDARDCEVLPYCRACAHVEFAMWMVGV
jgi:hypothetical protein